MNNSIRIKSDETKTSNFSKKFKVGKEISWEETVPNFASYGIIKEVHPEHLVVEVVASHYKHNNKRIKVYYCQIFEAIMW